MRQSSRSLEGGYDATVETSVTLDELLGVCAHTGNALIVKIGVYVLLSSPASITTPSARNRDEPVTDEQVVTGETITADGSYLKD